jgi:hypothetical protein
VLNSRKFAVSAIDLTGHASSRGMSRLPTSPLFRLALRGAGCLVFTVSAMGAGCPGGGDGGTTGGTGDFGTDSFESSSGDPSTTTPTTTTPSTSDPSTTTPTTTLSTTSDPATTEPTDTAPDTSDTDPTGTPSACLSTGTFFGELTGTEDLYGHFTFLKLFYAPDAPEQTVDETFDVVVAPDGTITLNLLPRDPEGFEGHEGLPNLVGTIDADCNVLIDGSVDYVGGGSSYGNVTVNLEGIFGNVDAGDPATVSITLEGGNIPNGPITYEASIKP